MLLLRLAAGSALIAHALMGLRGGPQVGMFVADIIMIGVGIFLYAGLWTPVCGGLAAIFGVWNFISRSGDPWGWILLATMGAAISLLGPGAWSVDARLFGWKRIEVGERTK